MTHVPLVGAQGAGDAVCLTGAVRDLHLAYPGQFAVHWQGMYAELAEHNPDFSTEKALAGLPSLVVAVTTNSYGDDRPHFATMWHQTLAAALRLPHIPVSRIGGKIILSEAEKADPLVEGGPYWLMFAGGKTDFMTKLWPPDYYQAVVDGLRDRVTFIQVGDDAPNCVNAKLDGVVSLVGKTSFREMSRLMYHAEGGVGPVSFGMHLAAAVEMPPDAPDRRAYVVIGGGRENPGFVQYPGHKYLSTIGTMPCCARNACWRYKVLPRDARPDEVTCADPRGEIAGCMREITPDKVIEAIEGYLKCR